MGSAQERFKEWWGKRWGKPTESYAVDECKDVYLAGYTAGAEDMRNKCVTRVILELDGEPLMMHVSDTLAALPTEDKP